jgi:hypothetical protein
MYNIVPPSSNSNPYYNRVYFCIEKNNESPIKAIEGFQCYRCSHLEEATRESRKRNQDLTKRAAIIPLCKWVPSLFDSYLLDYKLKKRFWIGNHSIYHRKGQE